MYQHTIQNQLLAKEQYGFRSKLSTDIAWYTLIHEVLTAMNNKHIVGGVVCELRKAFECVNNGILLSKLEQYGIVGKFKDLIKFYPTDRYQWVIIHDHTNSNS